MNKPLHTSYATASQPRGVAPTVLGPDHGIKEVMIVGGAVLILAIGMGIFWMTSADDDIRTTTAAGTVASIPVAPFVPTLVSTTVEPVAPAPLAPALPTQLKDSLHADVYFDFGRNGLSDEAKTNLDAYASFLNKEADWGVIIQGYTDSRGSSSYNRALGQKRPTSSEPFWPDSAFQIPR